MTCAFCPQVTPPLGHCAQCTNCGSLVCMSTCPPPNNYFHGAKCSCHCGKVFCEACMLPHSLSLGKPDASECFGEFARLASDAAAICVRTYAYNAGVGDEEDPRREGAERLSLFLNVMTPGWRALAQAVRRLPSDEYDVRPWPEGVKGSYVSLHPEVFSEAMIDRVFVLAMRSLGLAFVSEHDADAPRFATLSDEQRSALPALARWARGADASLGEDVLVAWSRADGALTDEQAEVVMPYLSSAAAIVVPADASDIVGFLIPAPMYAGMAD